MKSDIQIAQEAKMLHIKEVAAKLDVKEDDLELYGKYKAKISEKVYEKIKNNIYFYIYIYYYHQVYHKVI